MKNKHSIGIIIPSYNSKKTIVQCLNAVLTQSYKKPYKVIVVDSSEDGTDEIIKKMYPQVNLIHIPQKTLPGAARNIGVQEFDSEYVAFTDTDCIVDHNWIKNILKRMREGGYEAIGGVIANGTPESISGTLGYLNEFSFYLPGTRSGTVEGLATANVSYKTGVFREQKFIESHFAGEDTIFHYSIIDNGGKLFLDNQIKVIHKNRKGFINVLRHQRKIGEGAGVARIVMNRDLLLVQNPILCILVLPWIRMARMLWRIFLIDKHLWKKTMLFSPLSLLIAYFWSIGFLHSVLNKKTSV